MNIPKPRKNPFVSCDMNSVVLKRKRCLHILDTWNCNDQHLAY